MSIPIYQCVLKKSGTLRVAESHRKISSAAEAEVIAKTFLEGSACERMLAIYCNSRLEVVGIEQVAQGGRHEMQVTVSDIFRGAIASNASSIILAHNHPSGDPTPSTDDWNMTRRVVQCGQMLGISVLDHIVVGEEKTTSLRQENDLIFG